MKKDKNLHIRIDDETLLQLDVLRLNFYSKDVSRSKFIRLLIQGSYSAYIKYIHDFYFDEERR